MVRPGPEGTVYELTSSQTGTGTMTEFYDAGGRLLRKEVPGIYDQFYNLDYKYDSLGRLSREYAPYHSSRSEYTDYLYDDYGRLFRKITPQGDIELTYDGKTVTTTTPSTWSENTVNDLGLTTSVRDAGGEITYTYNSMGLPAEIDYGTYQVTMKYDEAGNRIKILDPNSGNDSTVYNSYGELISETDAQGNHITMGYDVFGRITERDCGADHIGWIYDPESGLLTSVGGSVVTMSYTYDHLHRIKTITKEIDDEALQTQYSYSPTGFVDTIIYPGGFVQENVYDDHGYLSEIKRPGLSTPIWELTEVNEKGQITGYSYGNGISTTLGYDSNSRIHSISAGNVFSWVYDFNDKGNPNYRRNVLTGQQEDFTFDTLNRLTGFYDGTMEYATNGNIAIKPKVGEYTYDQDRLNAVSAITGRLDGNTQPPEDISYTYFNKVLQITDNDHDYQMDFTYGPGFERSKMETTYNGSVVKTKYYAGNYEKIIGADGDTTEFTYISATNGLVAVNIKKTGGRDTLYYIHTDYLGSIMALTDSLGHVVDEYAYDAWGRRRDPADWNKPDTAKHLLDRGYTGHEHLDHFGLINMNGRVYDPVRGQDAEP